jgi:DNA-binding GntR family transcriptional regulator
MSRSLLRDQAYDALREAIEEGVLEPGERLNEADLVAWLGVSRTPIREALTRLEHGGLVETTPGRLTRVSPLDAKAAADAQTVVAAMHEAATREAVPRLTQDDLDEMTAANERLAAALDDEDVDAAIEADDAFHHVAVRRCGNAALASVLAQFTPMLRRLERLRFGSLAARTSVEQHDDIIRLCAQGAAVEAAVATRSNWQTLAPLINELEPTTSSNANTTSTATDSETEDSPI